jgi:hypothetical protein
MSIQKLAAAQALANIVKYGSPVTVSHKSTSYDPATGVNTVNKIETPTRAVIGKVSENVSVNIAKANPFGVAKFVIPPDVEIAPSDTITASGIEYVVLSVSPVFFSEETILIEIYAERQ